MDSLKGADGVGGVTQEGPGIEVTGSGTLADPYVVSSRIIDTDDQEIIDLSIVEGELSVTIEDGNTRKVDLISTDSDNAIIAGTDGALFVPVTSEVTASNGTNVDATSGDVKLGGALTEPTTITTTGTYTLAIEGLETGEDTDKIVVADENGVLRQLKAAMPKFFYMPSIIVPTSEGQLNATGSGQVTGDSFDDSTREGTINLYGRYDEQFGSPMVSSETETLPTLPATELVYHITWYDTNVFEDVDVDTNGVMTYTVKENADVTVGSFMNIVFSVKEDNN